MLFVDYLNASGVLDLAQDKHERGRLKEFARTLYVQVGRKKDGTFFVTEQELTLIVQFTALFQKLCARDIRKSEELPYRSSARAFAHAVSFAVLESRPLRFVSFASNAIDSLTGKIREKKQYKLPSEIQQWLLLAFCNFDVPWTYEVLLADHDFKAKRDIHSEAWSQNLKYLQAECIVPASLLSELVCISELEENANRINDVHNSFISQELVRFTENPFFQASFGADPKRVRFQMLLYGSLGVWLEVNSPTFVVPLNNQDLCNTSCGVR